MIGDRWQAIQDIANLLGIKTNIERNQNDLMIAYNEKEGERVVHAKLLKLNSELKTQEDLLSLIHKYVEKQAKENQ